MSILNHPTMRWFAVGSILVVGAAMVWSLSQPADAALHGNGLAFVTETFDQDQKPTGTFDAHWESEDGDQWQQGPEGVPVADAIRWARELTGIVLVTVGEGDVYSAGAQSAPDVARVWPEEGLPLRPRTLSRHWEAVIRISVRTDNGEELLSRVRRVLEESDIAASVHASSPSSRRSELGCVVEADSAPAALRAIYDVLPGEIRDGTGIDIGVLGPAMTG